MEAVQKQRRSVIKRNKREAEKLALGQAAVAKLSDIPSSTRKMRLVADLIRGKRVDSALGILKYQPKVGAKKLQKLLLSAIANWQSANKDLNIEDVDLFVKEIFVDGGRMLKRLRPAPQGRGYRVRKRSNHVTLVIDTLTSTGKQVSTSEKIESEKPKASAKATDKKESSAKTEKKATKKSTKNDKE